MDQGNGRNKLRVYIASKFRHGRRWRELDWWEQFELTSRWVTHYHDQVPDDPQFAKLGWLHDVEDVQRSDVLVLFGGEQDRLVGGLVEAGVALASGLPVVLVGESPDWGTWQHHPSVHKVGSLAEARTLLQLMASQPR